MNILYIAGESADFVLELCNQMCNFGHKVTCVVQRIDEYDVDSRVEKEHQNLNKIYIDNTEFFNPTLLKSRLIATLQRETFDIVIGSHTPISSTVEEIGRIYNIPWGIMILDIPTNLMKKDRNRMMQWLFWFDKIKYATTMIFNTKVARDEYEKYTNQHFPDENVITYAIHMPEKYGLSGKEIKGDYVLSICRLTDAKNVSSITKALGKLDIPIKQVVVGRDRGDLQNIKQYAKMFNVEVEHYENITELEKYELIKNSLVVIYPQLSEYIGGLSPWEGMYVGKPVIVSDFKVLRELYGENVIYYDTTDEDSLSDKISAIYSKKIELLYPKLETAYKYSIEKASFVKMASDMINIIKKVVR